MASIEPIKGVNALLLNSRTEEQSSKWDYEDSLNEFEQALALLDRLSDSLPDDPTTTQALNGLQGLFSKIHADFKASLL